MSPPLPASADRPGAPTTATADLDGAAVLDALDDADCRTILSAVDGRARSAAEIADACNLSLSSTYRKLDTLAAAGLVTERIHVDVAENNFSEYRTAVAAVRVSLDGTAGLAVTVHYRDDRPPATVAVAD